MTAKDWRGVSEVRVELCSADGYYELEIWSSSDEPTHAGRYPSVQDALRAALENLGG
jgi:hypothetical protein